MGSILVSAINAFSKNTGHLKIPDEFLVVRNVNTRKAVQRYLSIRSVTEGEEGLFHPTTSFSKSMSEDTAEGMQSPANDLMGPQVEQQKHYLRVASKCIAHCCPHYDTETPNTWRLSLNSSFLNFLRALP